ncbi:uncharacterized protein LOC101739462 [Bombyx mori]|uniref:Uncharacterized protein n=1 Tax=Bombyx mori TaxID=7091 RepID=A0A8R2AJ04_BOMMO|nr:uncharacterized protein LOC101739462 isoform X1 [Bombyx mori]
MPFVKNTNYRDMHFEDVSSTDFYTYYNLDNLRKVCKLNAGQITKCRTIGILQSLNGRYYLTELDKPNLIPEFRIQVSMVYLKEPVHSTLIPYPVQVFGTLQWKNRPVIFAKILQMLTIPMALKARDTLNSVTTIHLAKRRKHSDCDDFT